MELQVENREGLGKASMNFIVVELFSFRILRETWDVWLDLSIFMKSDRICSMFFEVWYYNQDICFQLYCFVDYSCQIFASFSASFCSRFCVRFKNCFKMFNTTWFDIDSQPSQLDSSLDSSLESLQNLQTSPQTPHHSLHPLNQNFIKSTAFPTGRKTLSQLRHCEPRQMSNL
jgi:hypothetical protein